jgi:hypothetical protein
MEMVVTLEVMKNRTVSNFHLLSDNPFKNKGGHSSRGDELNMSNSHLSSDSPLKNKVATAEEVMKS